MKYLLDTHSLLWWLFDEDRLSSKAREVIGEPENLILVSAASAWEISTKFRLGKLPAAEELVKDMSGWFQRAGFRELPVLVSHSQKAGLWQIQHRDPFDRMLAAQSALEEAPIISRDPAFEEFGIQVVW